MAARREKEIKVKAEGEATRAILNLITGNASSRLRPAVVGR
jgi:hypothetical protein